MLPFEEWVPERTLLTRDATFSHLLYILVLRSRSLLFLFGFFAFLMPFLPIFREIPVDLFFFEVSKVCFIFSEMLHSTSYSALLSSYTAEIPGGKIGKRKVNLWKGPEHLVFIVTDKLRCITFNKNFDVFSHLWGKKKKAKSGIFSIEGQLYLLIILKM